MIEDSSNLLNHVACSIFSFTNGGVITYANKQLQQQLEYTIEELTGLHVEKILTLSSRIFYQTHFFPLLKLQGEVNEVFLTLLSKNNSVVPVLMNASKMADGTDAGYVCACITVHQRKKYEDEILQAKKVAEDALHKNELLQKAQHELEAGKQELDKQVTQLKHTNDELLQLNDIVAHDLQEPVRKISLYVDLLTGELEKAGNKKMDTSLQVIVRSTNRIRQVLQSLQEYLYILTKEIKKAPVDLESLVDAQIETIREENPAVKFEVKREGLTTIEADYGQLKILFYELLKNCVAFRSVERDLFIQITGSIVEENLYSSTQDKYKWVEFAKITIEDNGIGFNPRYKDLIFRILKRLDYKGIGLGFGLAICKQIAENHMGNITASAEENKGAKFTILLPVAHY